MPPAVGEIIYVAASMGVESSKRSSTTVVGSGRVIERPEEDAGLPTELCTDCALGRRPLFDRLAYSGKWEKDSGVATTENVPGSCVPAFLSLSSSLVKVAKAGRSSIGLELAVLGTVAVCHQQVASSLLLALCCRCPS